MNFSVKMASILAVTATVAAAGLSTSGSSAAAQELAPAAISAGSVANFAPAVGMTALPHEYPSQDKAGAGTSEQPMSLSDLVDAQPQPDDLPSDMKCLAGAIYFESKGETLAGQLAVGRVIVARAHSGRFPTSYCGVVYQPSQFSFIRGRAMPSINPDSRSWYEAVAIAEIADAGSFKSPSEGALYFHAARVSPNWRMTRIARVDDHVFYR